jgi:hypothetical protein
LLAYGGYALQLQLWFCIDSVHAYALSCSVLLQRALVVLIAATITKTLSRFALADLECTGALAAVAQSRDQVLSEGCLDRQCYSRDVLELAASAALQEQALQVGSAHTAGLLLASLHSAAGAGQPAAVCWTPSCCTAGYAERGCWCADSASCAAHVPPGMSIDTTSAANAHATASSVLPVLLLEVAVLTVT